MPTPSAAMACTTRWRSASWASGDNDLASGISLQLGYENRHLFQARVNNFAGRRRRVRFEVGTAGGKVLVSPFDERHSRAGPSGSHEVVLEPYGYRWFRVGAADNALDAYNRAALADPADFVILKEYGLYCEQLGQPRMHPSYARCSPRHGERRPDQQQPDADPEPDEDAHQARPASRAWTSMPRRSYRSGRGGIPPVRRRSPDRRS